MRVGDQLDCGACEKLQAVPGSHVGLPISHQSYDSLFAVVNPPNTTAHLVVTGGTLTRWDLLQFFCDGVVRYGFQQMVVSGRETVLCVNLAGCLSTFLHQGSPLRRLASSDMVKPSEPTA